MTEWIRRNGRYIVPPVLILAAGVMVAAFWFAHTGVDALKIQFAPNRHEFAKLFQHAKGEPSRIGPTRSALHRDSFLVIPAYVGFVVLLIATTGRRRIFGRTVGVLIASFLAVAAGVADEIENHVTRHALHLVAIGQTPPAVNIRHAAMAKWLLLAVVGLYLWARGLQTPMTLNAKWVDGRRFKMYLQPAPVDTPTATPAPNAGPRSMWARLTDASSRDLHDLGLDVTVPSPKRIGVACSGGGIRSASFNLGALQVLRERGVLKRASHVTAVSGGGYLAAGWAIGASNNPDVAEDVYAPRSAEERWLRRHSDLIPDIATAMAAVGRVLSGLVMNALVIWLVLFAIARPAGWLVETVHSELRSREPFVQVTQKPSVVMSKYATGDVPDLTFVSTTPIECSDPCAEKGWFVRPHFEQVMIKHWKNTTTKVKAQHLRLDVRDGLVQTDGHKLKVVRQPLVHVHTPDLDRLHLRPKTYDPKTKKTTAIPLGVDGRVPTLSIGSQPQLKLVETSVPKLNPSESQFRLTAPRIEQRSGTTGRAKFAVSGGMWGAVGVGVGLFLLVQFIIACARPVKPFGLTLAQFANRVGTVAALGTLLFVVVLPWLVYVVPPAVATLVSGLPGTNIGKGDPGAATAAVASGGAIIVTVTAIWRAVRAPLVKVAKRWPMVMAKVAVAIVLIAVPFLAFISLVQMGAANGPGGHLIGLSATVKSSIFEQLRARSDVQRWLAALAVLLVMRYLFDAHGNSLFPFYKHQMSEAFAVTRDDKGDATPISYSEEIAWTEIPELDACGDPTGKLLVKKGYGHFQLGVDNGPELILCGTVNGYGSGEVPSGRRASSFVFSPTVIGGPDIGYMKTAEYLSHLGKGRRKDVTIPSAIAIAGAAFSPGMGKMSKGSIDNLLAIANARLGVWVPNPQYVQARIDRGDHSPWLDRPGWPQFIREVTGWFRLHTPYVYISDGGHWENLGMVELLRRGCRDVVVISAAGDGATSFSTIGEAIALAREELGLEISIDLEPMRAKWTEPSETIDGEALRRGKEGTPSALAAKGYAVGSIAEQDELGVLHAVGTIVILEANLSAKSPWDVVAWAEGNKIFPDDPTTDQNFSHRQLESYRELGRVQMTAALDDAQFDDGAVFGASGPSPWPPAPPAPPAAEPQQVEVTFAWPPRWP